MIRVGFIIGYLDQNWIGGRNYVANLIKAIVENPNRTICPVVLCPRGYSSEFLNTLPPVEILHSDIYSRENIFARVGRRIERAIGRDLVLEAALKQHKIDAISHFGTVGRKSKIPSLAWIPDFQHVRMPEFFSPDTVKERDVNFKKMIDDSRTVILSSYDARKDIELLSPGASNKSAVLHFTSGLEKIATTDTSNDILNKYGIDNDYFHLPNQFWAHKNHDVVIEALEILKRRGVTARVFATGHTNDQRNPDHFSILMRKVQEKSLQEYFIVLGVVPYQDLAVLMQNSVAVINPSLFEGWSTTVEEAKSFGKQIILSDIPVHREQSPARCIYFSPRAPAELADAMTRALSQWSPSAEEELMTRARSAQASRYVSFAKTYEGIIRACFS